MEPNIETSFKPLGKKVNSASGEFSPRQNASDGNLYYGSFDRKNKIEVDSEEDEFHAKIFMAQLNDKGEYKETTELGQAVNRKGFHNLSIYGSNIYLSSTIVFRQDIINGRIAIKRIWRILQQIATCWCELQRRTTT